MSLSGYDAWLLPRERTEWLDIACECGERFNAKCHSVEGYSVELLVPDSCPECGTQDGFECSSPDDYGPDPDAQRDLLEDR